MPLIIRQLKLVSHLFWLTNFNCLIHRASYNPLTTACLCQPAFRSSIVALLSYIHSPHCGSLHMRSQRTILLLIRLASATSRPLACDRRLLESSNEWKDRASCFCNHLIISILKKWVSLPFSAFVYTMER